MFDFVQYTLAGTSVVLTLVFTGLLVLLCIRTRSKGLIIITAALIFDSIVGLISSYVMKPFIEQWSRGELDNWMTQNMTLGQFVVLYQHIARIFDNGLLALGAFLIYREWRRGKIRSNWQQSSEVVDHA